MRPLNEQKIHSPGKAKVKNCSLLNGNKLEFKQTDKELIIMIPDKMKDEVVTTILLSLNIEAVSIQPIEIK